MFIFIIWLLKLGKCITLVKYEFSEKNLKGSWNNPGSYYLWCSLFPILSRLIPSTPHLPPCEFDFTTLYRRLKRTIDSLFCLVQPPFLLLFMTSSFLTSPSSVLSQMFKKNHPLLFGTKDKSSFFVPFMPFPTRWHTEMRAVCSPRLIRAGSGWTPHQLR